MARSYNYYDFREAKVHIYYALKAKGWETFSFKEDESDSMTDYYSPAYWSPAIATKNGFILCIDISDYDVKGYSGKEQYTYNYTNTDYTTNEKIKKLQALANDPAATEGEKQAALNMVEKLQNKIEDNKDAKEKSKQLLYAYPEFMANPGKCKWHIEKDGKIIDKGTGIGKFSDIPHYWDVVSNDIMGSRYWMGGEKKKPNETEQKAIDAFNTFIARVDNISNGCVVMGDGTEETEQAAQEQATQQGYEKVTIQKVKKVVKPVEVTDRKEIKLDDILSFTYHGYYWKVYSESEKHFSYRLIGSARRGYMDLRPQQGNQYYQSKVRLQKDLDEGKIKIYELKEVEEITEEEKWVKIKPTKANNTNKKTEQKETANTTDQQPETQQQAEQAQTTNNCQTPATFKQLRALYFITKINTKNANITKQQASDLISRANKGENIKEEIKAILNGEQVKQQTTEQAETKQEETAPETNNTTQNQDPYKQQEIEEGFLYNAHFKAWNYSIEAIQAIVSEYNIPFVNMGEKIGVYDLTAEQARQVKTISDANGSIFFIDNKQEITITEQEEENVLDFNEDILGKFDNIEVNNTSRITAEDQTCCEEQERMYNEFINFSNDYLEHLRNNSLSNTYYNSVTLVTEMNKTRECKKDMFISKVVSYFADKYKVTLKCEPIQKKYDISLDHNIIIDEIIEQLGGYTFTDKAEKELKDEFKNCLRYDRIKIKNKKISIESFFQVDYFSIKYGTYEVGYGSDEKFYKLFKALSHFLYGSNESYFHTLYSTIIREKNDNVFKTHDIANNGVKTLKIYKNGKIDLEFSSSEYMSQFAKEYCGYTGEQKTA